MLNNKGRRGGFLPHQPETVDFAKFAKSDSSTKGGRMGASSHRLPYILLIHLIIGVIRHSAEGGRWETS